ncbi:MAG: polysaccharide biosynthesis tyrosine autokinase [Deltaproteobacteria bacterium]|nr:MAG: polysaccharide biosynthesis tyrosine autokinase [Deltaproteobacteria bacterium]
MPDHATPLYDRWLDIGQLVEVLRQQRVVFLAFLGAVLATALVGTLLVTPKYQAVALVHLMPRAGQEVKVAEVVDNSGGYLESRERARTQIQIIQSRRVREEVLRLYNDLGYDDLKPTPEDIEAFGRALSAGPREDTQLVEIRVVHTDPERAAILANLVAEAYREASLEARTDAARETRVWLKGQTGEYRQALDAASEAVLRFKEEHDVVDIDQKIDGITARMNALQEALGAATTERVLLETKHAQHRRLLDAGQTDVLADTLGDPGLDALLAEKAQVATAAAEIQARYGDQHPDHRRAAAHLARVEGLIADEVRNSVDAEAARLRTLVMQEQRLHEELDAVKAELLEKQRLQDQYDALKMEYERARDVYERLGQRETEVDLQAHTRLNDVRIVDWAVAPTRPISPRPALNMAVALGVGIAGGLGLALLRHRLDETVATGADIEGELGETLLGLVPTVREADDDGRVLFPAQHPRSMVAESMRGIRGVLMTMLGRGRSRRIVVTSCLPAEGKTSIATGLAVAYAQLGTDVLLVEGDLRAPRLHRIFGLDPDGPGLGDALAAGGDPQRFVRETEIPRLRVLTGRADAELPGELLASPEMSRLLDRLVDHHRVIIIDTPPLGLVADAAALAVEADGVVVVARRAVVRRQALARQIRRLRQMGARVLGVVLNDVPPGRDERRYGYVYGDDVEPGGAKGSAAQ